MQSENCCYHLLLRPTPLKFILHSVFQYCEGNDDIVEHFEACDAMGTSLLQLCLAHTQYTYINTVQVLCLDQSLCEK